MKSPYLIFTEFSPLADPLFEPGRPGESAVEQGRFIVKAYNRDNILQKVKRHPTLSKSEFFGPTVSMKEGHKKSCRSRKRRTALWKCAERSNRRF
ncbi:hypothetical protein YC2023_051960 [Brassica napus]